MAEHNGAFPSTDGDQNQTGGIDAATSEPGRYRIEHDTMGDVRVPAAAHYQAQTQRAVDNFPISGRGLERGQIRALALIKSAAATVNARLGVVDGETASAISDVAEKVAAG